MFDWLFSGIKTIRFFAAAVTDRGLVRPDNQDAHLLASHDGLWAVADGMGGGQGGALASHWTCEALAERAALPAHTLRDRMDHAEAALAAANDRIRAYMRTEGFRSMGTTVALIVMDPQPGAACALCHAGDSRIYRVRRGKIEALTRDHTVGSDLAQARAVNRSAVPFQSRQNPLAHVLTRAVGTEYRVRPEWRQETVLAGDRFLICSDGIHDMLSDDEIAGIVRAARTPADAVARLADAVRTAGAGDNYTAICLFARAVREKKPVPAT